MLFVRYKYLHSELNDITRNISDAPPVCSSNVSLEEVMIENDCDIEPDYVQLRCSIIYSGNVVPVLKWNCSSELNDLSKEWTTTNQFNRTETVLTFKASKRLCDKQLACAVQTTATSKPSECVLPRLSIQCRYHYNKCSLNATHSPNDIFAS